MRNQKKLNDPRLFVMAVVPREGLTAEATIDRLMQEKGLQGTYDIVPLSERSLYDPAMSETRDNVRRMGGSFRIEDVERCMLRIWPPNEAPTDDNLEPSHVRYVRVIRFKEDAAPEKKVKVVQ